jgi:hypothetical protein
VPLGSGKKPDGASVEVPVVNMQAIGMGPKPTHYGNSVAMPAGSYQVTAAINGDKAVFQLVAGDALAKPGGQMGGMKMH